MRLIDADVLINKAWDVLMDKAWDTKNGFVWEKIVSIKDVADAPTIDAVPVVRCEYCEYSHEEDEFERWCYGFGSPARLVRKDDFCSHGKRR